MQLLPSLTRLVYLSDAVPPSRAPTDDGVRPPRPAPRVPSAAATCALQIDEIGAHIGSYLTDLRDVRALEMALGRPLDGIYGSFVGHGLRQQLQPMLKLMAPSASKAAPRPPELALRLLLQNHPDARAAICPTVAEDGCMGLAALPAARLSGLKSMALAPPTLAGVPLFAAIEAELGRRDALDIPLFGLQILGTGVVERADNLIQALRAAPAKTRESLWALRVARSELSSSVNVLSESKAELRRLSPHDPLCAYIQRQDAAFRHLTRNTWFSTPQGEQRDLVSLREASRALAKASRARLVRYKPDYYR
jgi:hypothetical protein